MPAIDTDLFQVLALALLLATLITLLVAVSTLGAIKKQLESGVRTPAAEPVAQSSFDYTPTSADYEPSTSGYEPAYTAPVATEPSAAAEVSTGFVSVADALEPAAASTATSASGAGLLGNEPEEQPFERDGRWWFKRGGELLVYDEGTGQWVAAPGTGAAPAATQAASTTVTTTTVADAGEGWKCASCGAVNGSTATSCRMCFAPR
jgi:hypothetical protein